MIPSAHNVGEERKRSGWEEARFGSNKSYRYAKGLQDCSGHVLMDVPSRRRCWHDGSSRLPSPWSASTTTIWGASLTKFSDTIKVRMQLSRRARAPGVVNEAPHVVTPTNRCAGKAAQLLDDGQRDCKARNASWSLQRSGCCSDRNCTQDGHPLHLL